MLTENDVNKNWYAIKGGLKNLWGALTDNEMEAVKKNVFEISATVEKKYGETKMEIHQKIQRLLDSFDNDTDKQIDPDVSSYHRAP
jgi:uncharacterized protein YjbJ (UPF0337 family)